MGGGLNNCAALNKVWQLNVDETECLPECVGMKKVSINVFLQ